MTTNPPNAKDKKNKIVIVDDDADLLNILIYSFEAQGYEVQGISNGKEAKQFLADEKNVKAVSLLILDRLLPDMDGLELLQMFEEKYHNQIPVLILSVLSAEKDVISGLKYGAIDYMSKPFNLPILMRKAQALLSHYPEKK